VTIPELVIAGRQTVAFEDAIPLSSRFAIMKVELDGPPGPDWDLANSVRWLIAMNLLLAKLDATNFTLSSVVVVPKHRNEPNMTRDSKVIELRSIRPPRAAPSQLPGVLQPGGIQPVCFSVAPLVPLEYRVVDFGQVRTTRLGGPRAVFHRKKPLHTQMITDLHCWAHTATWRRAQPAPTR